MKNFIDAIVEGNCQESIQQAKNLIKKGFSSQEIVTGGVEAAMTALDAKCTLEEFNLIEIMLAGRAATEVMKILFPAGKSNSATRGTVIIASMQGDVHDFGKNILKMILTFKGYNVVDCGVDCSLEKLLKAASAEQPFAIGISGLISIIVSQVREVKGLLNSQNLGKVKILAGGAALKQSSKENLKVDFVAQSAFDGLHYLNEISGGDRDE